MHQNDNAAFARWSQKKCFPWILWQLALEREAPSLSLTPLRYYGYCFGWGEEPPSHSPAYASGMVCGVTYREHQEGMRVSWALRIPDDCACDWWNLRLDIRGGGYDKLGSAGRPL